MCRSLAYIQLLKDNVKNPFIFSGENRHHFTVTVSQLFDLPPTELMS